MYQQSETNKDNVTRALKARAINSPVFGSMCEVFATRERTRQQITVHSLSVKMQKLGYKFSRAQYAEELKFLSQLGLGLLVRSKTGVVRALVSITHTLQSIGQVALDKKVNIDPVNIQIRNRPSVRRYARPTQPAPISKNTSVAVTVDGQRLTIDLGPNFTSQEFLSMVLKAATRVTLEGAANEKAR